MVSHVAVTITIPSEGNSFIHILMAQEKTRTFCIKTWGALRAYLSVNECRDKYVRSFSCILLVASNVEMWEKIYHINFKCTAVEVE